MPDIILQALTKAVEATQSILLQLEQDPITAAADGRATIPSLLRRLVKKCKQYPYLKQHLRSWWESAQDLLPEEADKAKRTHHTALLEEVGSNWDLPNWASNVEQCESQYGHA